MSSGDRDDWNQHWGDYSRTAEDSPAQRYRRELVFSLMDMRGSGEGARLLDIGSGQGDMAAAMQARFPSARVLGIEMSQSGVEVSRRKVPNARFVRRDLLDGTQVSAELQGWATHAVCSEVIEHVDDPRLLLKNARAYMSRGGLLVLTAPGGPMSAFDKHIGHRKHWRPEEIAAVLKDAGFKPLRTTGAGFPFFNLYRCLVLLRGKSLIRDVKTPSTGTVSAKVRAAMTVFDVLIRPSINSSHWGWQMVATARS